MAIPSARDCIFPQDLEAAAEAIEQLIGDRLTANRDLLKAVEATVPDMLADLDRVGPLLDELLTKGDGTSDIRTRDDISTIFGLQRDNQVLKDRADPTSANAQDTLQQKTPEEQRRSGVAEALQEQREEDEKFVFNGGVILVEGVMYQNGSKSSEPADTDNVEVLREVYTSVGKNFSVVEAVLSEQKTVFAHNELEFKTLPPKQPSVSALSLEEVRTQLGDNSIEQEDISVNEDLSTVVLRLNFLDVNKSLGETTRVTGLPANRITTQVFHIGEIDNSTSAINRYRLLGYDQPELGAILAGVDLDSVTPSPISEAIEANNNMATSLIGRIDFALSRFERLDAITRQNFRSRVASEVETLREEHISVIADSKFRVSTIRQNDTLTQLRKQHQDNLIGRLLDKRGEIKGIQFDAEDEDKQRTITASINSASPGSSLVSNKFLNTPSDDVVSQAELLEMYSDLTNAITVLNQEVTIPPGASPNDLTALVNKHLLFRARQHLVDFGGRAPEVEPVDFNQPFQGQPAGGSPGTILSEMYDPARTLDLSGKQQALNDSFDSLTDLFPPDQANSIARSLEMLSDFTTQVLVGCQNIVNLAANNVFAAKKRLDAITGQTLSATGNGVFENSLLKCAVNVNLDVTGDLFAELFRLLQSLAAVAGLFLDSLFGWLSDLINSVLCIPINLINSFLGEVENRLPAACQVPRVDFGDEINAALQGLRSVPLSKSAVLQAGARDVLRFKLLITTAPEKLDQFASAGGCNTPAVGNFYNTAMLNIGGSLPNPVPSVNPVSAVGSTNVPGLP